jgi:hypothetical protein
MENELGKDVVFEGAIPGRVGNDLGGVRLRNALGSGLLEADPNYVTPPASETWKKALNMAIDFMPGPGDVKAGQEAITGKNLITGDTLKWWERGLAGAGALPFLPNVLGILKGAKAAVPAMFASTGIGKVGEWFSIKSAIENIPRYRHGGLGSLSELHAQFPNMPKAEFDDMVLGLAKEGKIALHKQDLPAHYKGEMIEFEELQPGPGGKWEKGKGYYHAFAVKPDWR